MLIYFKMFNLYLLLHPNVSKKCACVAAGLQLWGKGKKRTVHLATASVSFRRVPALHSLHRILHRDILRSPWVMQIKQFDFESTRATLNFQHNRQTWLEFIRHPTYRERHAPVRGGGGERCGRAWSDSRSVNCWQYYSLRPSKNKLLFRSWWPRIRWCGTGGFQEQGQCLYIGLDARPIFFSYDFHFLFLHSMGWYYGAGVFGLIGC